MKNRYLLIMIMLLISISSGFAQVKSGWKAVDTYKDISSICFLDSCSGWVACLDYQDNGYILYTSDGGHTWSKNYKLSSYLIVKKIFFTNKKTGWLLLSSGWGASYSYRTVDSGKTWQSYRFKDFYEEDYLLTDMSFINEKIGWISAYQNNSDLSPVGAVFVTYDGGNSWKRILNRNTLNIRLQQISFLDKLTGFAADDRGKIIKSTDGGNSWSTCYQISTQKPVTELFSLDIYHTWACCDSGIIYFTVDGGKVWDSVKLSVNKRIMDIKFANQKIGWIVGNNFIYRSTDGGKNWVDQTYKTTLSNYRSISIISPDIGWIGGNRALLSTTTGGTYPHSISVKISGNDFICGSEESVLSAFPTGDSCSYIWSTGEKTQSIKVNKAGKYSVSVKDINGGSGSAQFYVEQFPAPEPKVIGDNIICKGSKTTLTASQNFSSYLWSTGDRTKSITVSQPGDYSLTVENEHGCKGSDTFNLSVLESGIDIQDNNDIDFGSVLVNESKTITRKVFNKGTFPLEITDVSLAGSNNYLELSLSRSVPLNLTPGDSLVISIDFNPKAAYVFIDSLLIHVSSPCIGYFDYGLTGRGVLTGINDTQPIQPPGIIVYPNPATTTAEIHLSGHCDRNTTVSIYNLYGFKLKTIENISGNQDNKITLNLENYPSGIYQVVLQSGSGHVSLPLVVIK